jgi:hypothetical protein
MDEYIIFGHPIYSGATWGAGIALLIILGVLISAKIEHDALHRNPDVRRRKEARTGKKRGF